MKTILLLLTLLFELLPGGPVPVRVTFSPLTKAAYLQAKKSQMIIKPRVTFPLKKQRGRIVIPVASGSKVFTDIIITEAFINQGHSESEEAAYTYLGYLPDFKCHLIKAEFYETTQWFLITAQGKQLALWGEPVVSPDNHRIAATCRGIAYGGGQPNIIQLLALQNGVLRQAWFQEPKTWEPTDIVWLSNNTLLLSKLIDPDGSKERHAYSKMLVQ